MPRAARKISSTKVYHVILRGNDKQDIFLEEQDYNKFIKEIVKTKEKYKYELYVYCMMTNHIHLIIYDPNDKLSKILQSISISYTSYFNKKYERVGHLFQNRFLSKNVETSEYLKNVCRYIHKNPVKSGIDRLKEYKWSSYLEYINEEKIIDSKQILTLFGNSKTEAINNFIAFHQNTIQEEIIDFLEYEITDKLNDEQALKYIIKILEIRNIKELKDFSKEKIKKHLKRLEGIKGISNLQIARITGLSRRIIDEIIINERRKG